MEPQKHNWIIALRNLPHASPFVDSRTIHAPAKVVRDLLEDHRAQGRSSDQPQVRYQRILAPRIWDVIRLLWKGEPKILAFEIEEVSPANSRLRIRAGFDSKNEFALAIASITLWLAVWFAWGWLMSIRSHLLVGGKYSHIGPTLPLLVFAALWLFCFSRFLATSFRPRMCINSFYEYLTKECGVLHVADAPLILPWGAFLQFTISAIGLFGIILMMSTLMGDRDRFLFFAVLTVLFSLLPLSMLNAKSDVRWLVGKAAFAATISLCLYLLFPLIIWALGADDLSQQPKVAGQVNETNSQFYNHSLILILGLGAALVILIKSTREAARYAKAIDYWRSHPESQRWHAGWSRFSLLVLVLMSGLLTGGLFWLAFTHSVCHCLTQLVGYSPWGVSVVFERAAQFIGDTIGKGLHDVETQSAQASLGGWLVLLFAAPLLTWGMCHFLHLLWIFVIMCVCCFYRGLSLSRKFTLLASVSSPMPEFCHRYCA